MLRFRQMRALQKFAAVHASVHDHFSQDRSLSSRAVYKLNRAAALGPGGAGYPLPEGAAGWQDRAEFESV